MIKSTTSVVLERFSLAVGPWPTLDPFLFCVHHLDRYPVGNGRYGPPTGALAGRNIGSDFALRDGWNMYHGKDVPGFPQHPHRGFETVTVVRQGLIDHADSLGAAARFGEGDTQWVTAGGGIVHSETFPLLSTTQPNPLELFQIWLNLPASDKMVDPYFTMLWAEHTPKLTHRDDAGLATEVTVVAGRLGDAIPPAPPPNSWAARADADVAIWHLSMAAGATFTLPPATRPDSLRTLYLYRGPALTVDGETVAASTGAVVQGDMARTIVATGGPAQVLMLQGRPIGEPIAQYGPFVMNSETEIRQAFTDYQRTQFGGWPWQQDAPVHGDNPERFARHPDGRDERPGT